MPTMRDLLDTIGLAIDQARDITKDRPWLCGPVTPDPILAILTGVEASLMEQYKALYAYLMRSR